MKSNACNKCEGNCVSCLGKGACVKCESGYYLVKDTGSASGICKPCDSTCKTCTELSTSCTSCPDKYELTGSDCISLNRVKVVSKFDMGMEAFIEIMDDLLQWYVDQVNAKLSAGSVAFTRKSVFFSKIYEGTVNADTVLSMPSAASASAAASGISESMSSGNVAIGGYALSGSAEAAV